MFVFNRNRNASYQPCLLY